jgi:N-acetylmuramoyl-L-alanine amidase
MMDIILHCSDSTFGNAVMIDTWHAEKGFKNQDGIHIGYHYVILNGQLTATKFHKAFDGSLETGRALDDNDQFTWDETAAATLGKNNCVQICLIGKSGKFTSAQLLTLMKFLITLRNQYGEIKVYQHSDFDPVNRPYCAGFNSSQMKLFNK